MNRQEVKFNTELTDYFATLSNEELVDYINCEAMNCGSCNIESLRELCRRAGLTNDFYYYKDQLDFVAITKKETQEYWDKLINVCYKSLRVLGYNPNNYAW